MLRGIRITPESVIGLESTFDLTNIEERLDYDYLRTFTRMHLFSRYEERKEFALNRLKEFFNPDTEICTILSEGILYAYLSIEKSRSAFLYVDKYNKERPVLEGVPDEEERRIWRSE